MCYHCIVFVCALQDSSSCLRDCKQSSKDYKGSILLDTHTNEILITLTRHDKHSRFSTFMGECRAWEAK
ncbi:hypothetical protein [Helicobacter bilis]|uniref:Uncharacterized protein n=1 Tax=Helicobacter bilis TaxID=37372 RepID=A0A4U8UBC2_9HELI|nr:hypothetical protein [Helicobacter bilis]MCI7412044.1 hypothetical protein [Helicobacter bilis]MDD7297489.1 hypothetical protein [Helicobacter bilis]MDY4398957.1 hypothetical protein [Helicobacter bilis]TLE09725.1 hypothetical protein LS78_001535 [Helicobacter bilis]TLE12188.1 hypothetical protein LS79_000265 [Helicobacter bilis]